MITVGPAAGGGGGRSGGIGLTRIDEFGRKSKPIDLPFQPAKNR